MNNKFNLLPVIIADTRLVLLIAVFLLDLGLKC